MKGKILAVNISKGKGERKIPVAAVDMKECHGIVGDAHAGDWHRQVSLLAMESIRKMQALGLDVGSGDFAENITTAGIDLPALPIGTRLTIGEVHLEVTQIGKECHTRCAIYYQAGDCVMPREGIFARVIRGGTIVPGDCVTVGLPPHPALPERLSVRPPAETSPGPEVPESTTHTENTMRKRLYANTRPHIISMRISDDEMECMKDLMERTNMKAADLMRRGLKILIERVVDTTLGEDDGNVAIASNG